MSFIAGPLSEIPFVSSGLWHYISEAADYHPLRTAPDSISWLLAFCGIDREVSLSSITGPCYFAVATDAIALGRWFDSEET